MIYYSFENLATARLKLDQCPAEISVIRNSTHTNYCTIERFPSLSANFHQWKCDDIISVESALFDDNFKAMLKIIKTRFYARTAQYASNFSTLCYYTGRKIDVNEKMSTVRTRRVSFN